MGYTKRPLRLNLSSRQAMIKELILDNLGTLATCIVLVALLTIGVRSCATTEATTYAYEDVRDLYNQYPSMRPMISKALSPDNYLTKWEYDDIRDEKYRLWELERKSKALKSLQVVKDAFPILRQRLHIDEPIQTQDKETQEVHQPSQPSQPSNGPRVIEVK